MRLTDATCAAGREPSRSAAGPAGGQPVTVVHLTAEYFPYARTGGLAEAVSGLADFQQAAGSRRRRDPAAVPHRARRRSRSRAGGPAVPGAGGPAHRGGAGLPGGGSRGRAPGLLHRAPRLLQPARASTARTPCDYPDNARRFAFFALAAADGAAPARAGPDAPPRARLAHRARAGLPAHPLRERALRAHGVHRALGAQSRATRATFRPTSMPEIGLPWELYNWRQLEWYGKVNFLKGGLAFADFVDHGEPDPGRASCARRAADSACTTSSSRWATAWSGVLNGIDQQVWDPADDPQITAPVLRGESRGQDDAARPRCSGRSACRSGARSPLFGMTGRLVTQKGSISSSRATTLLVARRPVRLPRQRREALRAGAGGAGLVRARRIARAARLHRPAGAPAHGGRRHLPHAVAVRALRPDPDAGAALRLAADRPATWAAWPIRSRTA